MKAQLIAHTQLSEKFYDSFDELDSVGNYDFNYLSQFDTTEGKLVALTAIRTCYSANKPTEIVAKEGAKYFGSKASDGGEGTDADRLFRHIVRSGHSSTLEHISFTFAIEGVSRALLAQLTRHRVGFSFSVQSQRYVRMGSDDKIGGFDYVLPDSVKGSTVKEALFRAAMRAHQEDYDALRSQGVPAEDARAVLPNAAATNLVMTANLTALLSFYSKRKKGRGAQAEITELAEALRREVVAVEPWTDQFFEEV
ncbi:FAD-dependent thymidylate synthase [Bacillus velezensis]|uniref:FAD-dependent thymidylate synthase n=1 Tax=Bacillus velezensis TaxID=492670 RepID=UPI000C15FC07|nr:FAD-dependent thymidylate synthase [Bacillus velezensis]